MGGGGGNDPLVGTSRTGVGQTWAPSLVPTPKGAGLFG